MLLHIRITTQHQFLFLQSSRTLISTLTYFQLTYNKTITKWYPEKTKVKYKNFHSCHCKVWYMLQSVSVWSNHNITLFQSGKNSANWRYSRICWVNTCHFTAVAHHSDATPSDVRTCAVPSNICSLLKNCRFQRLWYLHWVPLQTKHNCYSNLQYVDNFFWRGNN
jgi:hypothetical protein